MTEGATTKVLFVCLGNICRSPMAEAVFAHLVKTNGLYDRFVVDSAGTAAYHAGETPDKRTVQTCVSKGVPIKHRARRVRSSDFADFDYMLCMDQGNLDDLLRIKPPGARAHVALFGSYSGEAGDRIIEDPYYGGNDGFRTNFAQVTRCSVGLLKELGFSVAPP
ncbi:Low molecular weight phosphotyrosine protein phosphatase [Coemansia biformis]|uniref:Low molecular weight phosphotyrosine protein phosphatase n=1 Tax=Coemansia biformis TaxID=1286918 RepID=A0A9W7YFQ9_9FUNG|nr:Low molecular weight phosphotyrosine protein phosphatase [Coemansia biformis]